MDEMLETAEDMYEIGIIDKRRFEEHKALYAATQTLEFTGEDVKKLRSRLNVSQSVLASLLNASASAVRAWEAGTKKPGGPCNRLLQLLDQKGLGMFL